jgi:hypothetical protein
MAQQIITVAERDFRHNGYILGLYGSLAVSHRGNDIDLVAFPWRVNADWKTSLKSMESKMRMRFREPYIGAMNTLSFSGELENGMVVDLVFRETRYSPEMTKL